jgi:hypothetical protein
VEVPQLPRSRHSWLVTISQLNSLLQTVLLTTFWHGPHRKHPVSIVVVQLLRLTRNVFTEPLRRIGRCFFVYLAKVLSFVLRSFLQPPVTCSLLASNTLASALLSNTVYATRSPGNVKDTMGWTHDLMRKKRNACRILIWKRLGERSFGMRR